MKRKIKVLYVSAEIAPYANAGGLGEVGRSYPKALSEIEGYEIRRVMPLYKTLSGRMKYITDYPVEMDRGYETCILKTDPENKEIKTYFIENGRYYYRDSIYSYEDDPLRFFFFCKAMVEMLKRINYKPDIVHTNDWHTGLLPLLLKKEFPNITTIYTIHNISYQGHLPADYLRNSMTENERLELGDSEGINFMRAGIIYSDLLTTVSPGYCSEIKRPDTGCGMAGLLKQKSDGIVGILNGIDVEGYNPRQEGVLKYPYDVTRLHIKKKNKEALYMEYGREPSELPLVAMITRLDYAKGIELLIKAIGTMDFTRFRLVIMATGNPYYQGLLASIAAGYPEAIIADFEYDPIRARRIYGAADIYLMPSLFEPCGLGQMYAMRYGAVPVVNPVGGLKDTVIDDKDSPKNSTGFYMEEWSSEALTKAVYRAIEAYHSPLWNNYVKNCMSLDFSWARSAQEYRKLMEERLARN